MRIEHVKVILEIAKCGSISKAAQKLYIQQPNLSMILKDIEEEFHQKIFYRTPSGVSLTPFGKGFISFAQPYYKQYLQLREIGQNDLTNPTVHFSVCCHHVSLARWAFVELCNEYRKESIHLAYENESFEDIPQHVASNQYDIGIIGIVENQSSILYKLFSSLRLEYIPLCHTSLSIIVGKHHPFVKQGFKSINLKSSKSYPFVLYTPMETYLRSLNSFQRLINSKTMISLPDLMTVNEVLNKSDAFSIIPDKFMFTTSHRVFESSAVQLSFEDSNTELVFGYLRKKEAVLSEIGKRYIELLLNLT